MYSPGSGPFWNARPRILQVECAYTPGARAIEGLVNDEFERLVPEG
jgi:hypothetical protein